MKAMHAPPRPLIGPALAAARLPGANRAFAEDLGARDASRRFGIALDLPMVESPNLHSVVHPTSKNQETAMNTPSNETPQVGTTHRAPAGAARALAALAALAHGLEPFRRVRIARLELAAMTSHEARDLGIDTGIARFAASGGFIQR